MGLFDGKVAVVTGAGNGGMGARTAVALAKEGCKVVVCDMNKKLADETMEEIKAVGSEAAVCYTSITETENSCVQTAVETFGKIDILINCAAIMKTVHIWELSKEDFEKVLNVDVIGTFVTNKQAIEAMIKQGTGGKIINIASRAAFFGVPDAGYNTSKAAVMGFTTTVANDVKQYGIEMNTYIPSAVTKMFPMSGPERAKHAAMTPDSIPAPLFMDPEYLAPGFLWLAHSELSKGVTGKIFYFCGGDVVLYAHPLKTKDSAIIFRKNGMWTPQELAETVRDVAAGTR